MAPLLSFEHKYEPVENFIVKFHYIDEDGFVDYNLYHKNNQEITGIITINYESPTNESIGVDYKGVVNFTRHEIIDFVNDYILKHTEYRF